MRTLAVWIGNWNCWTWSKPRWFGLGIGIIALALIGHFSSYWVSLGVFLWQWSSNIDQSDL